LVSEDKTKTDAAPPRFEGEEPESYRRDKGSATTAAQIALNLYARCIELGSSDLQKGGVRERVINGVIVQEIIPNEQLMFVNACDMFYNILTKDILTKTFQKLFGEELQELEKTSEDIKKKYNEALTTIDSDFKKLGEPSKAKADYNTKVQEAKDDFLNSRVNVYRSVFLPLLMRIFSRKNFGTEGAGDTA